MAESIRRLFGRAPAQPEESPQERRERSRRQLHGQEQNMQAKAQRLEAKVRQLKQRAVAERNAGRLPQARQLLREVKMREGQLRTVRNMEANTTTITLQAESAEMAAHSVEAMRGAKDYMGDLKEQVGDVKDVEGLMGELDEVMTETNEMVEAVSEPLGDSLLGKDVAFLDDDDALDAELDGLEGGLAYEEVGDLPSPARPLPAERQAGSERRQAEPRASPQPAPQVSPQGQPGAGAAPRPRRQRYKKQLAQLDS
jgi:hypothetical protein